MNSNMSNPFAELPAGATGTIKPFEIAIPQDDINQFQTALKYSRIASLNYENAREDGEYGISRKWLEEAKNKWQHEFDWSVQSGNLVSHHLIRVQAQTRKFHEFLSPFHCADHR